MGKGGAGGGREGERRERVRKGKGWNGKGNDLIRTVTNVMGRGFVLFLKTSVDSITSQPIDQFE